MAFDTFKKVMVVIRGDLALGLLERTNTPLHLLAILNVIKNSPGFPRIYYRERPGRHRAVVRGNTLKTFASVKVVLLSNVMYRCHRPIDTQHQTVVSNFLHSSLRF